MSREWQQTKMKKYVMPHAVYHQCLWAVRDLSRMEKRLDELEPDGAFWVSDQSQGIAAYEGSDSGEAERVRLRKRIMEIYSALEIVPVEYRFFILQNIVHHDDGKTYPAEWKIWKQKFLFQVAKNLSLV